jgi:flavin-dependent dehydrogenase
MSARLDAIVAGGGPAGAAIGTLLARHGRSVMLFEKTAAAQDKMCGEFFSEEGSRYLAALGVDLRALGAVTIDRVRLTARDVLAECALPFPGLSLPRRIVDEQLLQRASESGVMVVRGTSVEQLTGTPSEWCARLSDGAEQRSKDAFVATGKYDLRGRKRNGGSQNDLVAFKMYFRLSAQQEEHLRGWVELILFPGGYAGLQLVGEGCANLSLLLTKSELKRCGAEWSRVLTHAITSSAHLASRLAGATQLRSRPITLSSIPYGYRRTATEDAPWYLGDQGAVMPSFTGDGMSIALHSAFLAADAYQRGVTAHAYQTMLARQLKRPVQFATTLSRCMLSMPALAQALRLHPGAMAWIASWTRVPSRFVKISDVHRTSRYPSFHRCAGDI